MRVLDRYLAREIAAAWAAVTVVLWLILVVNRLVRYLGEAAAGELPARAVLTLIGLKGLSYLALLMPVGLYLGALLALGRLNRERELVVMAACGAGPARLYRPLLAVALLAAALGGALSLWVAPWAAARGYEVQARAEREAETRVLRPGVFQASRVGRRVLYVEAVRPDGTLVAPFAYAEGPQGVTVVTAGRAREVTDPASGDRYLEFEAGWRYEGVPGSARLRVARFERHGLRIRAAPPRARAKHDALPTRVLLERGTPRDWAELHWRLAVPVSAVVLALLALPLARGNPRRPRAWRIALALALYLAYANLLTVGQVWVEKGLVPARLGMAWVHALMLGAAALLIAWEQGMLRLARPAREARA